MKNIDITQEVDPTALQPFTTNSLNFLQGSIKNVVAYLTETLIGNGYQPNVPYALWGLQYGGTQSAPTSVNIGYIFYNGEIYSCGGFSGTLTTNALFTPTIIQDPVADPLEFTDLVLRNVHNNNILVVTDSGTVVSPGFLLSQVVYLTPQIITASITGTGYSGTVKYFIDYGKQIVYLNGSIQKSTPAVTGDALLTLPPGLSPTVNKMLVSILTTGSSTVACFIQVNTTGVINIEFAPTVTGGVSINFDGLSFYVGW